MNCKQGELAVIKRGACAGKIIQCVKWVGRMVLVTPFGDVDAHDVWYCEPALQAFNGSMSNYCRDTGLRPIRDPGEDARDESLEWQPVPAVKPEDVWPFPPKKEKV